MSEEETPARPDDVGQRRRARGWAAFWVLIAPGLGAAGGSAFGPLRARWYVLGMLAVVLGALVIGWLTLHAQRRNRAVTVGLVLGVGALSVGLPWNSNGSGAIRTWEDTAVRTAGDAVFLIPEDTSRPVEALRPATGRIVPLQEHSRDDDAKYLAGGPGWILESQPGAATEGSTLTAFGEDGKRLWTKRFRTQHGQDSPPDVVAAVADRLVVWDCPVDRATTRSDRSCSLTALDRSGSVQWRRTARQDVDEAARPVTRRGWSGDDSAIANAIWITRDDRLEQLDPATGKPVRALAPGIWSAPTARGLLVADHGSTKAGRTTCRLRLIGPAGPGTPGPTRWSVPASGDLCTSQSGVKSSDRHALKGEHVIDLRSGAVRTFTAPDTDGMRLGGDLVHQTPQTQRNDYSSRAWITDPGSGRTLWSWAGQHTQVVAGNRATVATRQARSVNPFRLRVDGLYGSRTVLEVRLAPAGSEHPRTCRVAAPLRSPVPIGTDRVLARSEEGKAVLTRCD